jgi:hypothetical protein
MGMGAEAEGMLRGEMGEIGLGTLLFDRELDDRIGMLRGGVGEA